MSARYGGACLAAAALFVALSTTHVCAGGGSFDDEDPLDTDVNAGPRFFGSVKDRSGTPIPDAKVAISVAAANTTLVVRTDDLGYFAIKGFDKSIDPAGVDFSCSADGYTFFARTRQLTGTGPTDPISVTCLVEKQ